MEHGVVTPFSVVLFLLPFLSCLHLSREGRSAASDTPLNSNPVAGPRLAGTVPFQYRCSIRGWFAACLNARLSPFPSLPPPRPPHLAPPPSLPTPRRAFCSNERNAKHKRRKRRLQQPRKQKQRLILKPRLLNVLPRKRQHPHRHQRRLSLQEPVFQNPLPLKLHPRRHQQLHPPPQTRKKMLCSSPVKQQLLQTVPSALPTLKRGKSLWNL